MSRLGKRGISLADTECKFSNQVVSVKGKKGSMTLELPDGVDFNIADGKGFVLTEGSNAARTIGLYSSLINNMVVGCSQGFVRMLDIKGVGYRAIVKGRTLELTLGFSHQINYQLPDGVEAEVEKGGRLILRGYDKQVLGQAAAEIRAFRPPVPYKEGKGVRYADEVIILKEGKKK